MKKEYVKPHINYEHFSFLQNVASMCVGVPGGGTSNLGKPTWGTPTNCTWELPNWALFATGNGSCDVKLGDGDEFPTNSGDVICYNNPNTGIVVFGS